MTAADIITELYHTRFVEGYAGRFLDERDTGDRDDIVQEIYLMVCELNGDFLKATYTAGGINAIRRFVSGLICRQLLSDNSKVYRKYRLHTRRMVPAAQVKEFEVLHRDFEDRITAGKAMLI